MKLCEKKNLAMTDDDIGSYVTKVGGGSPSKEAIRTRERERDREGSQIEGV